LKYGKLGQGVLVKVSPYLVKRRKTHFHNLAFGASIIFGCNGYIWISPVKTSEEADTGGYVQNLEVIVYDFKNQNMIHRIQSKISF
jgi:exosome complex component RRP4